MSAAKGTKDEHLSGTVIAFLTIMQSRTCLALATLAASSGCMLARPAPATISTPPGLAVQTVTFPSASGSLLHAWLMRGRPGLGAVLLLHGVGANRSAMLGRLRFLHAAGYTVLAPDFQAHGESPGEHVTFGVLESLDAAAAADFLRHAAPAEPLGVIGVSMGGAAVLLGRHPLAADALVLESVYPTIRQATSDRLATWFGPFAAVGRLLTPAVIDIVGSEVGVTEEQLQPIAHIADVRAPVMVIAGTEDPYTPLDEADSLYARAPEPKTFWAVPGAGHEDIHDFAPAEYERRVGAFLARYLRVNAAAVGLWRPAMAPQPRLPAMATRPLKPAAGVGR